MNKPVIKLGRFLKSDDKVNKDIYEDLKADCIEDDDFELWLMQTPSNMDLKTLENSSGLNLQTKDSIRINNTFISTVPYKYESLKHTNGCNILQMLAPGENGELRSVNKVFRGHITIAECPTIKLQKSVPEAKMQLQDAEIVTLESCDKKHDVVRKRKHKELQTPSAITKKKKISS